MASTPLEAIKRYSREARSDEKRQQARPVQKRKGRATGYLFLLPWFVGRFVFTAGPVIASLYLSFTNYNLIGAPGWIGWQNYLAMFQDPQWWDAVRVTLVYVLLSVPLKLAVALLVALLLKRGLIGLGLFRAIYYIPSLLGSSVAIALLWRQIFDSDGLVNQVLNLIGIHATTSWVSTPDTALYTLLVVFNLIVQMVGAFQACTPSYIVSGGTGGPVYSTLFYTLYLYQEGFANLKMGYASAMAWVLLIAIAFFTALAFLTSRYWVFYQDERS